MKPSSPRRSHLFLLLLLTAVLSVTMRVANRATVDLPDGSGWVTYDNDGHYHMRRVERALAEGGAVAGEDPYLNHPDGSLIPWPPYYDMALATLLAPFAPEDPAARHRWVEQTVATVPLVLGVATSVLAALVGWLLAGMVGGLVAGTYHALCMTAVNYSKLGVADHHAAVAFLLGLLLVLLCVGIRRGALAGCSAALIWGLCAGLVAGAMLGIWVGALLYVVQVQLLFAVLILLHGRRIQAGLGWFGLAFHVGAWVAVAPAVWSSAWSADHPWMVVNLSWFHLAQLTLGALVFVPLLWLRNPRVLRAYPVLVLVGLALVTSGAWWGVDSFRQGMHEAGEWLTRVNPFMAQVQESRSLVDAPARLVFLLLGYGVVLLPIAWLGLLVTALRKPQQDLWPWVVAVPMLALQAARQNRFADALSLSLAVVVGWSLAQAWGWCRERRPHLRGPVVLVVAVLVACLAQWESMRQTRLALSVGSKTVDAVRHRALWQMCDWLRNHTPADPPHAVLANWGHGHTIEWVADRPTVATNFGTYVGDEGFDAVPRFLLTDQDDVAEALMQSRQASHVLITSRHRDYLMGNPAVRARFSERTSTGQTAIQKSWFATLGTRLTLGGLNPHAASADGPPRPRFLRLVHLSPVPDPAPPYPDYGVMATGCIWERVAGARIQARGEPGTVLQVAFDLRFPEAEVTMPIRDAVRANAAGIATLRLPYCTEGPNGDAVLTGPARWTFGTAGGILTVTEEQVQQGAVVPIQ